MSVSQAKLNDESQKNGGVCPVCGSTEFIEKNGLKTCAFCGAVAKNDVGESAESFVPSCPFCGGTDFDTDEDVFICRHCGESYFFDDLKQGGKRANGECACDPKEGSNAENGDKTRSGDGVSVSDKIKSKFYAPPESLAEKIKNAKREDEDRSGEQSGCGNGRNDGVIRKLRDDGQNEHNQNEHNQNERGSKENGESLTLGFLDAVSRLNETAYDLVDGNANVWARTAYDKNIIGREEKSEVGRIVAKRNRIAHGFGGKVRASKEDVDGAKKYYDVMIKTKNKIV